MDWFAVGVFLFDLHLSGLDHIVISAFFFYSYISPANLDDMVRIQGLMSWVSESVGVGSMGMGSLV